MNETGTPDDRTARCFRSSYAPLKADGPLPPGVTEKIVVDTYKARDKRPKRVLFDLDIHPGREPAGKRLRSAMDKREYRVGQNDQRKKKHCEPLHIALYRSLKDAPVGRSVYSRLVEPAEFIDNDEEAPFLDPARFGELVRSEQGLQQPLDISPGSEAEALALFALAYALLQEEQAYQIVEPLLELGSSYQSFFGASDSVGIAAVASSKMLASDEIFPDSEPRSESEDSSLTAHKVSTDQKSTPPSGGPVANSELEHASSAFEEGATPPAYLAGPSSSASIGATPYDLLTNCARTLSGDPPVAHFRAALSQVAQVVERENERLQQLDDRLERLEQLSKAVSQLEFVNPSISAQVSLTAIPETPLSLAVERATDRIRQVDALLQLHLQLVTLRDRLGSSAVVQSRVFGDLNGVISELERSVAELSRRLQSVRETERVVEDFLAQFAMVDELARLDLVKNAGQLVWATLASFIVERRANGLDGKRYLRAEFIHSLLSVLVEHLWQERPEVAKELIAAAFEGGVDQHNTSALLAYLPFHHIQEFGRSYPKNAPILAQSIFAAALVSDAPESLEYLQPLIDVDSLDPVVSRFYKAVLSQWRREGTVEVEGLLGTKLEGRNTTQQAGRQLQQRILDTIDHSPGMSGTYHRLRSIARAQFLLPLRELVASNKPEQARDRWATFGSAEAMVASCVRAIESMKTLRPVERMHLQQTRKYLEGFGEMLERWNELSQRAAPQPSGLDPIPEVSEALQKGAALRVSQCASLVETLEALTHVDVRGVLPAADFGRRCIFDGEGLAVRADGVVQPVMTHSWPYAVRGGTAPLEAIITDLLEQALELSPSSVTEAVDRYLRLELYEAARATAEVSKEIAGRVDQALQERRQAFDAEHRSLLSQAEELRAHDEYIAVWLDDIGIAIGHDDFERASNLVGELAELVRHCRGLRDPVRKSIATQLEEAGVRVDDEMSVEALQTRLEAVRGENETRRSHIRRLLDAAADEVLPSGLRDSWQQAAQRLDRPRCWPASPEEAERIGAAVDLLHKFVHHRTKFSEGDRDSFELLVDALGNWVPSRLICFESNVSADEKAANIGSLIGLAESIKNFAPDHHIFALLGATSPSKPLFDEKLDRSAPVVQIHTPPLVPEYVPIEPSFDGIVQLASEIRAAIISEPKRAGTMQELRRFCLVKDWVSARLLAATLARSVERPESGGRLKDVEVLYAIAVAQTASPGDTAGFREAIERACLALAVSQRAALEYCLSANVLRLLGPLLLLRGASLLENSLLEAGMLRESWTTLLAELKNVAPEEIDDRFEWLARVLSKASRFSTSEGVPASASLALTIWEILTGSKEVAVPRSDLLDVVYRMGRTEALQKLAQTTGPLENLVANCLSAFDTSRSNPEVRPLALQIAMALKEQGAEAKVPLRPWLLFFDRLSRVAGDSTKEPISVEVKGGILDPAGRAVVEIHLTPTGHDVPYDLAVEIQIGSGSSTNSVTRRVLEEELLLKPKIVSLDIPFTPSGVATPLDCAYRLIGSTVRNRQIDVRGRVTIAPSQILIPTLTRHEIETAWPGASGDPVNTQQHAFHGREKEIHEIDAAIRASDRQRSIIVIGQRRIGKTSLLLEMVRSLPPQLGTPCGAFVDVAGLQIPDDRGSIPGAFFQSIVAQLDKNPENEPLRKALRGERHIDVTKLARGLEPHVSFTAALEGLVDRLNESSGGLTSRLALFVDEFDRFVSPYLTGRRDEVDALMWQLRQIVQRSRRISLILAGSGLQKLLFENYEQALYGSMDVVSVEPFRWDTDRPAIRDTFLPERVRSQLCSSELVDSVCHHATEVCGGHPWYLAVFGRSAAVLAKGRQLTVPLLNEVLDTVVRHDPLRTGVTDALTNDPARFYAPSLESLGRLDDRSQAIAKTILARLAQRVTVEFPWLPVTTALSAPELVSTTDERERRAAIQNLEKEQIVVIDRKESRVRLRTPITAAALRDRALSIMEEALLTLRSASH